MTLQLVYDQIDVLEPVTVCDRLFETVIRQADFRHLTDPREALHAVLGSVQPLAPILGVHPDYRGRAPHPVHELILKTVTRRLTSGIKPNSERLVIDKIARSALVIGGPVASSHAEAIFGSSRRPSVLESQLPIRFDLAKATPGSIPPEAGARLIIDGRSTKVEHFVLTSLPMGDYRLINISALTSIGGAAVDFVIGDPTIIARLSRRARRLRLSGWQAAFAVRVRKGRPIAVDPEFSFHEVTGIDFDSSRYALNDPEFLQTYSDPKDFSVVGRKSPGKLIPRTFVSYAREVEDKEKQLSEILNRLSGLLKDNPELGAKATAKLKDVFAELPDASPEIVARLEAFRGRKPWAEEMERTKSEGKRNPATFIREVYADGVSTRALQRWMLWSIDYALAEAFASWIKRHAEDRDLLPAGRSPPGFGAKRGRKKLSSLSDKERQARDRLTDEERQALFRRQRDEASARWRAGKRRPF